jgi:hypothetical protein
VSSTTACRKTPGFITPPEKLAREGRGPRPACGCLAGERCGGPAATGVGCWRAGRPGELGSDLIGRAREEVSAGASRNRFADLLEAGGVPRERLTWLAGEQFRIVGSDRRSIAPAARFPDPPAGEMFLFLAQGELRALRLPADCAAASGWGEQELRAYEPRPLAQAYPAYLAWSALSGACSGIALAMLANLEERGGYCGRWPGRC